MRPDNEIDMLPPHYLYPFGAMPINGLPYVNIPAYPAPVGEPVYTS